MFTVGAAAGTLNVVAGGGSFLTLPVLIFLGLPATVANATNRVGILAQNVGAVWGFDRHGVLERKVLPWAVLPAAGGSLLCDSGAVLEPSKSPSSPYCRIARAQWSRMVAWTKKLLADWTGLEEI